VAAHYGTSQCYNVLPINDDASSFQLFAEPTQAVGLRLYRDIDCLGDHVDVLEYYSPSLPAGFDNVATSCTRSFSPPVLTAYGTNSLYILLQSGSSRSRVGHVHV
jgi:hypothetical protein